MFMLIGNRDGRTVECVPDFPTRRDAEHEARRLNSLPTTWQAADGRVYHRPCWQVVPQPRNGPCRPRRMPEKTCMNS